jgi:hypothetical protein
MSGERLTRVLQRALADGRGRLIRRASTAIAVAMGLITLVGTLTIALSAHGDGRTRAIAAGTFRVTLTPESEPDSRDGVTLRRMSMEKTFEGDLSGSARGEMLSVLTPERGSAGYVAIERVSGALHGREGSFVLQHSGSMNRGAQQLGITIVPDSGTAALAGIEGAFALEIVDGAHRYTLEYSLPK